MAAPINTIANLLSRMPSVTALDGARSARGQASVAGTQVSFAATIKDMIADTSRAQDKARDHIADLVAGRPVDMHQVMIAAEEASLSLEMIVEMRNKFLDAHRTLTNLQ